MGCKFRPKLVRYSIHVCWMLLTIGTSACESQYSTVPVASLEVTRTARRNVPQVNVSRRVVANWGGGGALSGVTGRRVSIGRPTTRGPGRNRPSTTHRARRHNSSPGASHTSPGARTHRPKPEHIARHHKTSPGASHTDSEWATGGGEGWGIEAAKYRTTDRQAERTADRPRSTNE